MADRENLNSDERLARAELLREKTGASFEEARDALEASGYDMLDAIVWLESRGKVAGGGTHTASYTTAAAPEDATTVEMARAQHNYEKATQPNGFTKACGRAFGWLKAVLKKSLEISFVIEHKGSRVVSMPLLLFIVLLLIPPMWLLIPAVIVSLFFDVRYHFVGVGPVTVDINQMSDKVSEGAEALKRDMTGAGKDDEQANGTSAQAC